MNRTHIGKHRLEALRDHYRRYLFEEYLLSGSATA